MSPKPLKFLKHKTYFDCGYFTDSDTPSIETYVYLGTSTDILGSGKKDEHIFQRGDYFYADPEAIPPQLVKGKDQGLLLVNESNYELIKGPEDLIAFLEAWKTRDAE